MNLPSILKQYSLDVLHLFYPHVCIGCGSDILGDSDVLCAQCFSELPTTGYFPFAGNPVERLFAGRIPVQAAGSTYYFTKQSLLQRIVHDIKYKGNAEAALFAGKQTGIALQQSNRFSGIDVIVPLPLSKRRLHQRGYNQSYLLAKGISHILQKPVAEGIAIRRRDTKTLTHQTRAGRWQTVQYAFTVHNTAAWQGKHILLVDDIVTTGATLEACGSAILSVPGTTLSIATAAHTI